MENKIRSLSPIEKKNLKHIFWCSGQMWGDFTMVKMEGNTYAYCMFPVINEVYGDHKELATDAFIRNTEFFNTHAAASGLIFGLSYALERERAANPDTVSGEMITNIKTSLMGPLAAVGDSVFFNCIRVIAAGVGISLASQGNPLGALLFVAIYGGIFLFTKWKLLNLGYTVGTNAITKAFQSGVVKSLSDAACAMGLVMVGALVSAMVSISSPAKFAMGGGTEMILQDIFDGIISGFLKLVLLFFIVFLIRKKWKPIWIIFLILALGIIGSVTGVL